MDKSNKKTITQVEIMQEIKNLKQQISNIEKKKDKNKLCMIIFSGDLDKIIAAFIMATGAAAMGTQVSMFFTFWGTTALRDPHKKGKGKNLIGKMFGFMLPKGVDKLKLSKMHMAGLGTSMIRSIMKKKKVPSLPEMIEIAEELEVRISICEMSMDLMGMKKEEMIDYNNLRYCGVATCIKDSCDSFSTLFI